MGNFLTTKDMKERRVLNEKMMGSFCEIVGAGFSAMSAGLKHRGIDPLLS